jgi:hypothetical protein
MPLLGSVLVFRFLVFRQEESGDRPFGDKEAGMVLRVAKSMPYEFSHFGSLKTCGYDRHNGEKELGQLLRLESLGETHARKDQIG